LPDDLAARLRAVLDAVDSAARRAGRDPAGVRIVAVTKTHPPETVAAALAAGLDDLGENYVQEARAKRAAVGGRGTWHLIGGLQRNKVRAAASLFDRVHTLDSAELAEALAGEAERAGRRLPVLIQVNVAGDPRKRGVDPDGLEGLARIVLGRPALVLDGLMTIASPERPRDCFRALREARDRTAGRLGVELPHLSMGMSSDFCIAVEEGATLLRLGRVLFGERGPGSWRPGAPAGGEGS
jgi:pyridoxal phosphate enzyme (YggS family)